MITVRGKAPIKSKMAMDFDMTSALELASTIMMGGATTWILWSTAQLEKALKKLENAVPEIPANNRLVVQRAMERLKQALGSKRQSSPYPNTRA